MPLFINDPTLLMTLLLLLFPSTVSRLVLFSTRERQTIRATITLVITSSDEIPKQNYGYEPWRLTGLWVLEAKYEPHGRLN